MQTILFIDGRNFISKISYILNPENSREKQVNFSTYDFSGLLKKVLTGIELDKKIFYLGKLGQHKETEKKSNDLIEKQRLLKLHLEQQGFEVILAGRVRGHIENCPKGHEVLVSAGFELIQEYTALKITA